MREREQREKKKSRERKYREKRERERRAESEKRENEKCKSFIQPYHFGELNENKNRISRLRRFLKLLCLLEK